jgi:hypothetical protein
MKILTIADVPDELAQEWLQHLRDFDAAHPGCHFDIAANAPNVSSGAAMEMLLEIEPPFPFYSQLKKQ